MLLALETSTRICSVAFSDAEGRIHEKRSGRHGAHSEKLFLFIQELMQEHHFAIEELEGVLVSEGPGSYTGLRIAASAVKGLLFRTKVPLYAVPTLAAFAWSAVEQAPGLKKVHGIIDARRVHVYHQAFSHENGFLIAQDEAAVITLEDFENIAGAQDGVSGTGFHRLSEALKRRARLFDETGISARSLIGLFHRDVQQALVRPADPEAFEPAYHTSGQVNNTHRKKP